MRHDGARYKIRWRHRRFRTKVGIYARSETNVFADVTLPNADIKVFPQADAVPQNESLFDSGKRRASKVFSTAANVERCTKYCGRCCAKAEMTTSTAPNENLD
jgi:hypothetical protein